MVYVKRARKSCDRAECPVCYEKWASKRAHAAAKRISFYQEHFGGRPIHVVASPSQKLVDELPYRELKKRCELALKMTGFRGGVEIFHPWREKRDKSWYLSPHFHEVGFGWILNSEKVLEQTGVLVKNLGIRKSVYATIMYQLSHCGVYMLKPKKHSITWWGALSYNKLKIPRELLAEDELCPLCLGPLKRLIHYGELGDPPDIEDEYVLPEEGWRLWLGEPLQVMIAEVAEQTSFPCEFCGERFESHELYQKHSCPVGVEAEDW